MTRSEVIEALCILRRDVMAAHGHIHATDCICMRDGHPSENFFQDDGHSLKFIENTVREALRKHIQRKHIQQTLK